MNFKKAAAGLMALVLLLGPVVGVPLGGGRAFAAEVAPISRHNVYQISSVDDLLWAAENPDKNYVLTNDIDLSGQTDWTPIGTAAAPFSGTFNGAGHTITLGINQTKSESGIYLAGLFGSVSGTVANLTVGGTITAAIYSGYVGGVAANIAGGRITGCTSNVQITAQGTTGVVDAGGIAGAVISGSPSGTIQNCINNGNISVQALSASGSGDLGDGTSGAVGGILGFISNGAKGYVITSVNNGDVTVSGGKDNVGGIVGQTSVNNNATAAHITYCANKGDVTYYNNAGERASGIIGYVKSGVIDYCYNTGNIIAYTDNGTEVARRGYGSFFGIFGYANLGSGNQLEVKYCYNASPEPLEAEICVVRNPSYGTFQNFYLSGRDEYETQLNSAATAGTSGTEFSSASDLYTKITSTEDGANAYTSNPEGGYPLLYFEKATTLADQDYDGLIETEPLGDNLQTIYYVFQTGGSVDTQGLTVSATLFNGSSMVETAALTACGSVRIGDTTYAAVSGGTLYSAAINSIADNLWTTATLTAQKDGQTVFTTSISNSNGVAEPAVSHGVYQISSANDLLWAAGNPDKNYVLTNDIDLSGQTDWTPIGTAAAPFSGSFNGAGHTVTLGINQTRSENGIYLVGLFGYVSGTVANLTVGGTVSATLYSGYVGGVAANIAGGKITGCTSNAGIAVQGATGITHVGGVAGSILNKGNPAGTIQNCTNNGEINVISPTAAAVNPGGELGDGTNGSVGGILGYISTFAKGYVSTSVNNGDITVTNGKNNVGGIVGQSASSNNATAAYITYCANKGDVTIYRIAGERAAGIIGYVKGGLIQYCYNIGSIIAYTDDGTQVSRSGYGAYYGIFGYANIGSGNPLAVKYCYNASPEPLEAEICVIRNPQYGTFQNFYLSGRTEYETELNSNATAGTPGTEFSSASDLYTKLASTEDGASAYTADPDGGYPILYFEKASTLADQDYDGTIEKESVGNDLNTIYYLFQTGGSVDTQGLTVNATLTKGSATVETVALTALPSGGNVRIGDTTYAAADGCTLYSAAMNSIHDSLWTQTTITAQKDGQTVFTRTITNNSAPTIPGGLPDYPDGTLSKIYNAGPGMASDQYSVSNEDSEMVVISETSAETFNAYVQNLLANGFEQLSHTETDGNLYDSLKQDSRYFYLYYTAYSHQARIILDKSTNTLLSGLDPTAKGNGSTEFYLYSLDYTNGEGQTDPASYWQINCGALMIVKLADNSLFVIDSGHQRQSSEAAQYGLMKFMYKITGQPYGSKINIKGWFFSHAHGDHVYLAHAFIDAYHDNLNVESVLFNIPSFQTMGSGYDSGTFLMKQSFNTYFPHVKYVKLHTGQSFSLQGVGFDVLHTHEDSVSSSGVTTITDFNDTSTIFKLTMDGKSIMMLGDAGAVCQSDLLQMYSSDTLRSDVVQVAHHGYNNLASLYDAIGAPLAIVPNSEVNAKDNNPSIYNGYARPGVTVLFADPDTYKLTVKNGNIEYATIPSYREDLGLYSVSDLTLNIGADQTERNVVWYSDAPTAGKVQLALKSAMTGSEFPTEHQEFSAVASDTNVTGFKSNKATITGLAASTEYVYRVGTDDGWSQIYSFKTQGFAGDFSFLFAGDPQIGSSGNEANDTAGWTNTLNKSAAAFQQASFLISAGDQVETAATETQYDGFLSSNALKSLALAVNVGNHDVGSNAFSQHYNMPNVSTLGASSTAGSGSGDYWYIYNNTLFLSINSNNLSVAEHSQFLQNTVNAHGQDVKWKVVTFHHSIYSVASHALNSDILQRRDDLAPVFSQLGIDVVMMGHDHVYTRSYMMNGTTPVIPEGGVPSSVTNPGTGQVLYITANSASGSKYYAIQNTNFPYAAVKNQENTPNITKVDVTDTSFTVTTYRVSDMSVVDTFTINRVEVTPPTVTGVTVTPPTASVQKGNTQSFSAAVSGDNSPAQTVTWSVTGNTSSGTSISSAGLLTVAADETASSLTVTATSTVDTSKSGTAAVTVTAPPPTVTGVTVTPLTASVQKGNTQSFSAAVSGDNNPAQTVTWSVTGNTSSGTSISSAGLLTVAADETASSLTVTATSTVDTSKSGTAAVTVTTLPPTVTGVTVTPSTASVQKGNTQSFSAAVSGDNGPAQTVTWSVAGSTSSGTSISSTGLLTVAADETASSLTVTATSTVDTSKSGTAAVTVVKDTPQKTLTGISLKTPPAKVNYVSGQSLDVTGAAIKLSYSDGSDEVVAVQSPMVSGFDTSKAGSQTLTVTYQGKTAVFDVNVISSLVSDEQQTASADLSYVTLPGNVTSVTLDVQALPQSGAGSEDFAAVGNLIDGDASLGELKNLAVYDLKLLDQNGNPIESFTGKLKVKILIPSGMIGDLHVFWYDPDTNRLTDMNAAAESDYLVFETDHFSSYAIAQLAAAGNPSSDDTASDDSSADKTDNVPDTGDNSPVVWIIVALAAASVTLYGFRRKQKSGKAQK